MKIVTFNVNSIRARLHILIPWLEKNKPDILTVQETKVQDDDFPKKPFEDIGYHCAFKGQKSYNGVAILSKQEPRNIRFGLDSEPKDEPRLIKAQIDDFIIVNTYVPQGSSADSEKFDYKLEWFERLLQFFQNNFKPTENVIWTGDLNVAPNPVDLYDPGQFQNHVCFHPKARLALAKVMQWGFLDVFRLKCPQPGQYTFWDYRLNAFKRDLGWRIDHIMTAKHLVEKCTGCYIDKEPRAAEKPSDHTPLIAEFQ